MPSKVAIDPEVPSLGRIRADSIAPPHSSTSIKLCISRVERNPELAYADLFTDTSCVTPLKERHISLLRTDGPGLSPNLPMAIVQVKPPPVPDGRYVIKNRAEDIFWSAGYNPITTVYFYLTTLEQAKDVRYISLQWDITYDTDGNISLTSPYTPSSWVGADVTGSTVPVPWRLIPADSESYYLTMDVNLVSPNPRVPAALGGDNYPGTMDTLKEGDQRHMWMLIPLY